MQLSADEETMLARYTRLHEVLRTVNARIEALTRAAAAGYNEMQGVETGLSLILTQIKASVYAVERASVVDTAAMKQAENHAD